MRLATIDIGSNSVHLLVVEVDSQGHLKVLGKEREMVRLGAGSLKTHHLSEETIKRTIATLLRYRDFAKAQDTFHLIATATSAVRESNNRDEFIKRVKQATGIRVEILSASEEARLIALAVNHVFQLRNEVTLIVDIGGGSTEFAITRQGEPLLLRSNKLGAVRLTDKFITSDPPRKSEIQELSKHIQDNLIHTAREVRDIGFQRAVGTSGTAVALTAMATRQYQGADTGRLTRRALKKLNEDLISANLRQRRLMLTDNPQRADIIIAGGLLLEEIMTSCRMEEIETCDWALREGVVLNFLQTHSLIKTRGRREAVPFESQMNPVRSRSVLALARRFGFESMHAYHITFLATRLFDQTVKLHKRGNQEREWLEAAALLHDIGYFVSHNGHHRHSQYLIRSAGLLGFSTSEVAIIAALTRYHRKSPPRVDNPELAQLTAAELSAVMELSGILRVADALDRSHRQLVSDIRCKIDSNKLVIKAVSKGSVDLEVWAAQERADLLQQQFGLKVKIKAE